MKVIGVTGGVGTGKSTVAGMFGRLGAQVLDADQITHELMKPGTSVWRKIRSRFGKEILGKDKQIDRRRLGELVFGRPGELKKLSQVIHPAVRRRIRQQTASIRRKNPEAVVVLDVPLLIEAGSAYRVDALIVVSSSLKAAAGRLKRRSGWSLQQVRRRQGFQLPLREKERVADFVVRNNGSQAATRRQVARIWQQVVKGE